MVVAAARRYTGGLLCDFLVGIFDGLLGYRNSRWCPKHEISGFFSSFSCLDLSPLTDSINQSLINIPHIGQFSVVARSSTTSAKYCANNRQRFQVPSEIFLWQRSQAEWRLLQGMHVGQKQGRPTPIQHISYSYQWSKINQVKKLISFKITFYLKRFKI